MKPAESHRRHDLTRYRGRNLLYLLLAICLPAGLLYLRLVLGLAATGTRVTPVQATWLNRASMIALLTFFLVQLICARYIQRLLRPRQIPIAKFLQYLAVLLLCIFFSLTGAVILEAFGFNFFLRMKKTDREDVQHSKIQNSSQSITERLNQVYSHTPAEVDPVLQRTQIDLLKQVEW